MDKLNNLSLTPDQIKVITDLIDKGAIVEIIYSKDRTKITIKKDNSNKIKTELIKK